MKKSELRQIIKEEIALEDKNKILNFVKKIPDKFPEYLDKLDKQNPSAGRDGNFYMLVGALAKKYQDKYNINIQDILHEDEDEYFLELMYGKFGESIEF